MQEKPNYSLYIGKVQALPSNVKYSYYNSNGQYILLYTENKPDIGDYRIVKEDLYSKLQSEEKKWLLNAKTAINAEHLKKNAEMFVDVLSDFAKSLEQELKLEK